MNIQSIPAKIIHAIASHSPKTLKGAVFTLIVGGFAGFAVTVIYIDVRRALAAQREFDRQLHEDVDTFMRALVRAHVVAQARQLGHVHSTKG